MDVCCPLLTRKYVYDEHYDCVLCPEYQALAYHTTNRDGYREYRSDPKICVNCPTRHLCTHSKDCVKTVQRHVWKDYEELADDARYTPEYRELYQRRKETIERVFADAKEKHAMRCLCRRKRETRHALYPVQRLGPGVQLGEAEICCHESQKTGQVAVPGEPCLSLHTPSLAAT